MGIDAKAAAPAMDEAALPLDIFEAGNHISDP